MAECGRKDEVDINLGTVMKKLVSQQKSKKSRQESQSHSESNGTVTDDRSSSAVKEASNVRKWYERYNGHHEFFEYSMRKARRGKALIINNKNFTYSGGKTRQGTDFDRDSLIRTLKFLGFRDEDITVINDAKVAEMRNCMKTMAQHDYTDYGCSFVAILSHGDVDLVDGKDGSTRIDDLMEPFRNSSTLIGKPKIFLFQCCLGENYDSGMKRYEYESDSPHTQRTVRKISRESDFLIAYSTIPGYYSWRSVYTGSWFIQSFCDVMDYSGRELEFQQCLARVCHIVSNYYESCTGEEETSGKKQSPLIHSTLTKELYFS